jgi:apolipoprotein N-acyltransferase
LPRSSAVTLAALTGVLYAAAQPDRGAWPFAFVCLVPLLAALRGRNLAARAGFGWLAGGVAGAVLVLHPTGIALARYFELAPAPAYLGSFVLSQLYGALPFVGFAALCGDPARGTALAACARAGAALVVAEGFRSWFLGGLPWGLFAYALAPAPWLAQAAAWGGAALLGFALAALNAAWLRSRWLALALAATVALPGAFASSDPAAPGAVAAPADGAPRAAEALRVRLVQGNLPAAWRRDPRRVPEALARLGAASDGAPVDLVVWPESALAAPLPANLSSLRAASGALDAGAFLLLGAPRTEARDGAARLFNSAVLVAGDGRLLAAHDKTRLVPIAESRRETPGAAPRALALGERRVGALICYELVFAGVARALVRDGAELLVNLSNDEWFGTTRGVEQHFAAAVIRAIETRRPLLRATNTGVTAAVDAWGRVVARLPSGQVGALVVDVRPAHAITLAVRFGDWVTLACALALAFALVLDHRHEAAVR